VAVSHSLLTIIYHVLKNNTAYSDLGAEYFDQLDSRRMARQAVCRLEQLGYTFALSPKEVA